MLPPAQKELWPNLRTSSTLGFVLYGGTAIALQLGHRTSLDFDFFTDRSLNRQQILSGFPFLRHSTLLQDQPQTLSFLASAVSGAQNQVKVSFFGTIDHGRVGDPRWTDDEIVQVASLDDLMATKLKTMLQRIEANYRDVAAMLKAGVNLAKGLASAARMYGTANFQPSESLKALVYFEGGDLDQLTTEERRVLTLAAGEVRDLPPAEIVAETLSVL